MKKYITICTLLFILFNANLLFSQELVVKYDNRYGIIAFNRIDKRSSYSLYYGINYLNKNIDNINGYLIPPILDHIRLYKSNSNLDLVDFEITNKWYRGILLSDIVSELNKILGVSAFDQYYSIILENSTNEDNSLWTNYWGEILSKNKDLKTPVSKTDSLLIADEMELNQMDAEIRAREKLKKDRFRG